MEDGKSVRTYDIEGFKLRAGCVCVKDGLQKEVLLVSSSKCVNKWIIPAGSIKPGEDPIKAATREVEEEAGVNGMIEKYLGVFQDNISKTRTSVYKMHVDSSSSYQTTKENKLRKWFPIQQALIELNYKPVQKMYILKMMDY